MGEPMAVRIVESGRDLLVFDRRQAAMARCIAAGAQAADGLPDLARRCDVVMVCVEDDDRVRQVVADLLAEGPGALEVLVIHSTILPLTVLELSAEVEARGVEVIDAPVSGDIAARNSGGLTMMIGGSPTTIERCRSLFGVCASSVFIAGGLGAGEALKLANNLLALTGLLSAIEAVQIAGSYGVDVETLQAAVKLSTGDCYALRNLDFFEGLFRNHTLSGSHAILDFLRKDLWEAADAGQQHGLRMQLTAVAAGLAPDILRGYWGEPGAS